MKETQKDLSRLISGIRASGRIGRRNGGEMKMDVVKSIKESREALSRGRPEVRSMMSRGKRPGVLRGRRKMRGLRGGEGGYV